MDLVESYTKALGYDSGIAAAKANYNASEDAVDISRSPLLPLLVGTGEARHVDRDTRGDALDTSYKSYSAGLSLTQPLFNAADWFSYEASKLQTKSAEAQFNLAQQQLILDVATAYFNVLRAEDALAVAVASEKAIGRQYEQAQERYNVGLIAITAVYEARATFDDSKSARIAAESQVDLARERLARLTGEYIEDLDNLEQDFPLTRPVPNTPTAWEKAALTQNWSVFAAEADLLASEKQVDVAKAGHYPTLDLFATYGVADTEGLDASGAYAAAAAAGAGAGGAGAAGLSGGDYTVTEGVIGLRLNVPIYSGGGVQASVRRQRSLTTVAEENLKTVRRDVQVNARSLFLSVNTNVDSVNSLEQTIVSRSSALDATEAGYDVGTRNIVEVLDSQRAYYVSLRDYANARYDYVLNSLNLKQAAGTLGPEDLAELNRWLSPTAPGIQALAERKKEQADAAARTRQPVR